MGSATKRFVGQSAASQRHRQLDTFASKRLLNGVPVRAARVDLDDCAGERHPLDELYGQRLTFTVYVRLAAARKALPWKRTVARSVLAWPTLAERMLMVLR